MKFRRLSSSGAYLRRRDAMSAIEIVLDAEAIQRPTEDGFKLSVADVAARSGRPLYLVRKIGLNHFTELRVAGRVVGYDRGYFYVADNEATAKLRAHARKSQAVAQVMRAHPEATT